jgi:hypothetical protein
MTLDFSKKDVVTRKGNPQYNVIFSAFFGNFGQKNSRKA